MRFPDFSSAYADFISESGEMKVPVSLQAPTQQTWALDDDGLMMSGTVLDIAGNLCCLSVLFPMAIGAAQTKLRQKRFPVKPGDSLTIRRMIDRVVGLSGEEYGRFQADVFPLNGSTGSM